MQHRDFIKYLKKALRQVIEASEVPEARSEFGFKFQNLVILYLEEMERWFVGTDEKIQEVFNKYSHQMVSEQDRFSKELEITILSRIRRWVTSDSSLRKDFIELSLGADKKIKSIDTDEEIEIRMKDLKNEIDAHVALAKNYGEKWTKQIDNVGIVIKNNLIRNTINYFREEISYENIMADFTRDLVRARKKRDTRNPK